MLAAVCKVSRFRYVYIGHVFGFKPGKKKKRPKYQYGTGCLSDGILGMWMASVCGLDEVLDNEKVRSHLVAVHKYNLKHDLVDNFNPQRPVYACGKDDVLLLCT